MSTPRTYRPPPRYPYRRIRILQEALADLAALAEAGGPEALAEIQRRATEAADPAWVAAEDDRRQALIRAARDERIRAARDERTAEILRERGLAP